MPDISAAKTWRKIADVIERLHARVIGRVLLGIGRYPVWWMIPGRYRPMLGRNFIKARRTHCDDEPRPNRLARSRIAYSKVPESMTC
jgi:hypothetical protein